MAILVKLFCSQPCTEAAAGEGPCEVCTLRRVCTHTGAKPEALADEGSLPQGWYKPGSGLVMICNTATGKCAAGVAGFDPPGWFMQGRDDA